MRSHFRFSFLKPLSLPVLLALFLAPLPALADGGSSDGLPGRRVGGGSRGCGTTEQVYVNPKQLVALVPGTNQVTTVSASPTFLFHIPKLPSSRQIEFVLRDEADRQVYETTFLTSTEASGILKLQPIPSDLLKVGKRYYWYFSLVCNSNDRSQDIVVEGWLQRVLPEPLLAQQLATATPQQQAQLYIQRGFWQDALTVLATLRTRNPQDPEVNRSWVALLQSAGLGDVSQAQMLLANLKQVSQLVSSH